MSIFVQFIMMNEEFRIVKKRYCKKDSKNKFGIQFDYAHRRFTILLKGSTGFDSEMNGVVSMPSYEINAR